MIVITRHLLSVPYAEKDQAKSLGARWDQVLRRWYVPLSRDLDRFHRWRPEPVMMEAQEGTTLPLPVKTDEPERRRRDAFGRTGSTVRTYAGRSRHLSAAELEARRIASTVL